MSTSLDTSVSQHMTRNVATIAVSAPIDEAIHKLDELGVSGLAVVDEGRVAGVFSLSDVVRHANLDKTAPSTADQPSVYFDTHQLTSMVQTLLPQHELTGLVREHMSERVISVRPEATIAEAAKLMLDEGVHRVFVLNDQCALEGVLSAFDILRVVAA